MKEAEEIMKLYNELIHSEKFNFPVKGLINVSDKQGVYIIFSPCGDVLHVGTTKRGKAGLNQRLYDHTGRHSSFRNHYLYPNNLSLRNGFKFSYIEIENGRQRALLEALTAGLLCPAHLGTGEKKL